MYIQIVFSQKERILVPGLESRGNFRNEPLIFKLDF